MNAKNKEQRTKAKNLVVQAKNDTWKEFEEKMEDDRKENKNYFVKY